MLFGKRNRIVKRILIVEDEPLTAFDNESMITEAGYELVATVDGFDEAIAKLDEEQVDLIVSDVRLNGKKTGLDLAKIAKKRGIPVLFATGNVPAEARDLVAGCIHKPYNQRTLKAALEALDNHLSGRKVKVPKGLDLYGLGESA